MRLAEANGEAGDLQAGVFPVLDARLRTARSHPLALALSGGGDSVALLLLAKAWADRAGRSLLVLSVDHRLQPQSAAWTEACARRAARLGLAFQALGWTGEKPRSGLPAAARTARHRLLAEAARAAGASVILMGHTADDVLEARAMRGAGSTTPEPREWAPSPAWPEGRGVFLLRPLLNVRRAALRAWLVAQGESWVEDPANADLRYARARARAAAPSPAPATPAAPPPEPNPLAALCAMDEAGVLAVSRDALRLAPRAQAQAFLGAACLCAAGTVRPPAAARTQRLLARLAAHAPVAATLAGARIEADADEVRVLREPGEAARGALAPIHLRSGETRVWDGRFEIAAERDIEVRPLARLAARLPAAERARLAIFAPKARAALPAAIEGGRVTVIAGRPLALGRLEAACGLVEREP